MKIIPHTRNRRVRRGEETGLDLHPMPAKVENAKKQTCKEERACSPQGREKKEADVGQARPERGGRSELTLLLLNPFERDNFHRGRGRLAFHLTHSSRLAK